MGNAVKYKHVAFMKAINAKKSFEDFYQHEKHHGFAREEYKLVHDHIRRDAGMEIDEPISQSGNVKMEEEIGTSANQQIDKSELTDQSDE